MKRGIIYFFIGLSLGVWLVEMFTGWFAQALLRSSLASPIHSWCFGVWIYDFRRFPYENGVVERRIL